MQNLDTHKLVESFIARGVPKEQAEVFVETGIIIAKAQFNNFEKDYSNLVTKNDLKMSLMEFKEELMKELDLKFTSIDQKFTSLMIWMISLFSTTILSILALVVTIFFNKG